MYDYTLPIAYRARGGLKEALQKAFFEDEDIRELTMPKLDNENYSAEDNWYGGTFYSEVDGKKKVEKLEGYCFDVPFIDDTLTDNRLIITVEVLNRNLYYQNVGSNTIEAFTIIITVFCHKDCLMYPDKDMKDLLDKFRTRGYTGNRLDMVVSAIQRLIENEDLEFVDKDGKYYGMGKAALLKRVPMESYQPNPYFYGIQLMYGQDDIHTPNTMSIKDGTRRYKIDG